MTRITGSLGIRGRVSIDLVNGDKVISTHKKNLTVTSGYNILGKMVLGTLDPEADKLVYIAVGAGGHVPGDVNTPVPPLLTDTALEEETARAPIYLFEQPNATTIRFRTTIDADVANGDVTEAGIFTESGTLFARVTFPAVHKVSPWYLIVTWEMTFSEGTA